jgi:hypothetical protein
MWLEDFVPGTRVVLNDPKMNEETHGVVHEHIVQITWVDVKFDDGVIIRFPPDDDGFVLEGEEDV